jgi:hypothetical protein
MNQELMPGSFIMTIEYVTQMEHYQNINSLNIIKHKDRSSYNLIFPGLVVR